MEVARITVTGEDADRIAPELVERKADQVRRSINKFGVRNVHKLEGEGFAYLTYERGSAHEDDWLVVSLLVETVDDRTRTVTVFVGGGGEGAFKWEELTMKRIIQGPESVGEAGRFLKIVEWVERVAESLDLAVDADWLTEKDRSIEAKVRNELFGSGS